MMKKVIKTIYNITDLPGYVICFLDLVNIIFMIMDTNLNSIINVIVTTITFLCHEGHRYLVYKGKAKGYADRSILIVLIGVFVIYIIYVFGFAKI